MCIPHSQTEPHPGRSDEYSSLRRGFQTGVIGSARWKRKGIVSEVGEKWGVVLAGGSGSRLSALTIDATGMVVPKQYCSFLGGPSLVRTTIQRLKKVVDSSRIVVVVSSEHRKWWELDLGDIAPENIIVQPCNRGTACGVLLPVLSILHRDPRARIVVSPSDHYVRDEETLIWSLMEAQAHVDARPRLLVLLGMEPDRPETEYGWITPSQGCAETIRGVTSFVEKPDAELADELMRSGALWSSFTFVATGKTLMGHFRRSMPRLVERFSTGLTYASWDHRRRDLLRLYDTLPTVDFSRLVLAQAHEGMHVLPVPPCGWTDLGTPQRVSECAARYSCPHDNSGDASVRQSERNVAPRPTAVRNFRHCDVDLAEVALRASESSTHSKAHHSTVAIPSGLE
jgi:mannose-1-phosphate guanylyltransferase